MKLIISSDKADKLVTKLRSDYNLELKTTKLNDNEVLFVVSNRDEWVVLKVLNDIVDQENELWLETHDGNLKFVPSNCLYFEARDQDIILKTSFNKIIYLKHTLNDLEEMLINLTFQRISKSQIVNLKKITYLKPLLNSKIEITLSNDLKLVVNRTYIKAFKKALKTKGGL